MGDQGTQASPGPAQASPGQPRPAQAGPGTPGNPKNRLFRPRDPLPADSGGVWENQGFFPKKSKKSHFFHFSDGGPGNPKNGIFGPPGKSGFRTLKFDHFLTPKFDHFLTLKIDQFSTPNLTPGNPKNRLFVPGTPSRPIPGGYGKIKGFSSKNRKNRVFFTFLMGDQGTPKMPFFDPPWKIEFSDPKI